MRKHLSTIVIIAAIVGIVVLCFLVGGRHAGESESAFEGTDAQVTAQIEEAHPDYQPWMESLFSPGSAELESGLFATQAAAGGVILGFCCGALWARRRATASTPTSSRDHVETSP